MKNLRIPNLACVWIRRRELVTSEASGPSVGLGFRLRYSSQMLGRPFHVYVSKNVVLLSVVLLIVAAATACGGNTNNALSPQFQPQVANLADNFQFQTTGITNVTQTLDYTWQNSGIRASINQACAITAGTGMLTIRDSQGIVVYSGDMKANGTFTSIAGTAGSWQIHIELTNTKGTLNFRAQKM